LPRKRAALLILCLLVSLIVPAAAAGAQPAAPAEAPMPAPVEDDTVEVGADLYDGKALPLATDAAVRGGGAAAQAAQQQLIEPPAVGDERAWLALDDLAGRIYLKDYTLRGVGDNIEVWVASAENRDVDGPGPLPPASNLDFPEGDCRNDGVRNVITDEQVDYLVSEFDGNIYPTESEVFSVPPERDGTDATLNVPGIPGGYWEGEGDNIVVLVDNVRDDNFYDTDNQSNFTYIAGFFYSVFNEFHDRNIMTIDGFDWLHRTGDNPPNEPSTDLCTNAPARPFLYESVFAHEYQHLLEYYEDPDEVTWVNEGLSDFAQTLTGYVDPSLPVTDIDFDSHVQCFLGYLSQQTDANPIPRADSGPENSLTLWGDQGPEEILCDYGAAYTMVEFLAGRYGPEFLGDLHREDANGFEGLQLLLDAYDPGTNALDVVHDWAAMVALDSELDSNGGRLLGSSFGRRDGPGFRVLDAADYTTPTLDASINWDENDAYDVPGAPPNGSDYVRLRGADGSYLSLSQLSSLSFDGSESLPSSPVEWTVDPNPPGHEGDPALYSGSGPNFDRAIIRPVTVPAEDATLTFDTQFQTEVGWDFGFVQVSTDGGETYTSLENELTTVETDPGAIPAVQQNVPGFTGDSGGWVTTSFDLSAYAGQEILLSFRYVTDSGVDEPGWWVDNVTVGGELLSDGTDLEGWSSATEVRPTPVAGFTVQLVAYSTTDDIRPALLTQVELGEGFVADLRGLRPGPSRLGARYDTVAAIVTYDEPTESVAQYAPYTLVANGVVQPGG
jgi:hypothetical protein